MYTTVLAIDVSFLNGIKPFLPDFLLKEVGGPLGVAMALGFIALVIVGIYIGVGIANNHNNGDASAAASRLGWWIFAIVFMAVMIPLIAWIAN